MHFTIDILLA